MQAAPARVLPELRLAPASLGATVGVSQRVTWASAVARRSDERVPESFEALLEIDADALRLACFTGGMRVLTLRWDGRSLQESRHPTLPPQVQASQVLRDIQLAYWPVDAIAAALPAEWAVQDTGLVRVLSWRGEPRVRIVVGGTPRWLGRVELDNLAEHYRLVIESAPTDEAEVGGAP